MISEEHRSLDVLRVTVAADTSQLSALRHGVMRHAASLGAPDDVVEMFGLALSELATNVILHTDATEVTAEFGRIADDYVLDVTNGSDNEPEGFELPEPTVLSGRGLFIVEAVMDVVAIVEIDGVRYVRCMKYAP